MIAFSPDRIRDLRQHKDQVHATLVLPSENVRADRIRFLWREYMTHDEDGNPQGVKRERVHDVNEAGELSSAVITILRVDNPVDIAELHIDAARDYGFRTAAGVRNAWEAKHPQSPLVVSVWFALGDLRDKRRFLTSTRAMRWIEGGRGGKPVGDYTSNPRIACDDAEVLSEVEFGRYAMQNRQKDVARKALAARAMSGQSLSARMAAIEAAGERMRVDMGRELRVITYQVGRCERQFRA